MSAQFLSIRSTRSSCFPLVRGLLIAWLVLSSGCSKEANEQAGESPQALPSVINPNGSGEDETTTAGQPRSPDNGKQPRTIYFEPYPENAGVTFAYINGQDRWLYTMVESICGGIGILDFDRDGRLDFVSPGGGGFTAEPKISFAGAGWFHNVEGDPLRFEDVSPQCRASLGRTYSAGANVGDFDADGFPDVLITGYGGQQLFRNLGDGSFEEVTSPAGLSNIDWSASSAWGDINNDGLLDLYISHYMKWSFDVEKACYSRSGKRDRCVPTDFEGESDELLIQIGDGTFNRVDATIANADRRGLGVVAADFDADGDIDFYVTNDGDPNNLLENRDGAFTEIGVRSGTAIGSRSNPDGSMGIAVGDYDGNGLIDLLVTNYQNEYCELYANQGQNFFRKATGRVGITGMGTQNVAWGTAFFDGDLDGDEDLIITAGHTSRYPDGSSELQRPFMLENQDGRFELLGQRAGDFFGQTAPARGLAMGDLDRDGDLDVIESLVEKPLVLLENQSNRVGHFLSLELIGTQSNRDAVGAIVTCTVGDHAIVRHRFSGGSYASSNAPDLHFGFPSDWFLKDENQIDGPEVAVEIQWPSGQTTQLANVSLDRQRIVVENQPDPELEH